VVDREVAHGVVECQLLPGADRPAGDEVEGLPVVEAHTAVGVLESGASGWVLSARSALTAFLSQAIVSPSNLARF